MAYIDGGLIQANDYNNFVGTDPSAAPNRINTVWGVGNGRSGYGQIPLPLVASDSIVSWSNWNNLINTINNTARHQGTTVPAITINESEIIESEGENVSSAFDQAITSLYDNRNNCAAQAAGISAQVVKREAWGNHVFFSHTITFDSGDAARNFFNAGGQIAINFTHPSGSGVNTLWNTLTQECGTVVISSPISGTARIAGVNYSGVTKIGGSGSPTTLTTNTGYYNLNTSYREVFKQRAASGNYKYLQSFISVNVKSNGTRGSNGDTGNVINIVTKFDQVPDGAAYGRSRIESGSAVTVTLRPPSTAYIANTWGTPLVVGSVLAVNNPNYQGYTTGAVVTTLPGGAGEALFTNPGTYTWQAPLGITRVSAIAVGGGGAGGAAYWAGGGGGGGGLGWKNNISVTPGQNYTVVVGAGGIGVSAAAGGQGTNGGDSSFINATTVCGRGGGAGQGTASNTNTVYAGGLGGGYVGDGGGNGGTGGNSQGDSAGAGGGAGGYAGKGGNGGSSQTGNGSSVINGVGGGGAGGAFTTANALAGSSGSGGGTGLLGQGNSGTSPSQGGSGASNGSPTNTVGGAANTGGWPGGGGGGQSNDAKTTPGCNGANGAVRIIWSGNSGITRAFPNTNTDSIVT